MNRSEKTRLNRELTKETPRKQLLKLIDDIGCIGIERDIAFKRFINKETANSICMDLHISTSTYYRIYRNLLIKISKLEYN